MVDIYEPHKGISPGLSRTPMDQNRCKAGVWSKDRWGQYAQCARKIGVDGWCAQHHPDAERKRDEAATAKYNADMRKTALGWYGERMMAALIKIRAGDNDPRETARLALDGISYAKETPDD